MNSFHEIFQTNNLMLRFHEKKFNIHTYAQFQENVHENDLQRNDHSQHSHKLSISKDLQKTGTLNIFAQPPILESEHIDKLDNLHPPIEINTDYEKCDYIELSKLLRLTRPYLEFKKEICTYIQTSI